MAKGSEGGRTGHDIDGPEMMRFGQNLNFCIYNHNLPPKHPAFTKISGYVHGHCWLNNLWEKENGEPSSAITNLLGVNCQGLVA